MKKLVLREAYIAVKKKPGDMKRTNADQNNQSRSVNKPWEKVEIKRLLKRYVNAEGDSKTAKIRKIISEFPGTEKSLAQKLKEDFSLIYYQKAGIPVEWKEEEEREETVDVTTPENNGLNENTLQENNEEFENSYSCSCEQVSLQKFLSNIIPLPAVPHIPTSMRVKFDKLCKAVLNKF